MIIEVERELFEAMVRAVHKLAVAHGPGTPMWMSPINFPHQADFEQAIDRLDEAHAVLDNLRPL